MRALAEPGLLTSDGRSVPIIFVTGFGDVLTTVRAMKPGAFEFLTRPIDTAALLQSIGSALEHSAALTREDRKLAGLQFRYQMLSPREGSRRLYFKPFCDDLFKKAVFRALANPSG